MIESAGDCVKSPESQDCGHKKQWIKTGEKKRKREIGEAAARASGVAYVLSFPGRPTSLAPGWHRAGVAERSGVRALQVIATEMLNGRFFAGAREIKGPVVSGKWKVVRWEGILPAAGM